MLGLSVHQAIAVAIVVIMLALFVWDRWRYDLVALAALLAAVAAGVVPQAKAFEGFSDDIIIVIAAVLVVSKAVARSGLLDRVARRLLSGVDSLGAQLAILSGTVALLSGFVKNVGTLAIFMPIAIQTARRFNRPASLYLMPLAFASLIGGTITQIGTSPNLLISAVRAETGGKEPFSLFDFAWVGLPLTVLVVAFLSVGWRLLPADRKGAAAAEEQFSIANYTTELVLPAGSPFIGRTVGALEKSADDIIVVAVTREAGHNYIPSAHWPLYEGDILTVQAEPQAIKQLVDEAGLALLPAGELPEAPDAQDELTSVEVIVTANSPLIGQSPRSLALRRRYDINLLAVSRAGQRRAVRLQDHVFQSGDVLAVQGWKSGLPETTTELGLLPLADRGLGLGRKTDGLLSLGILAVALVLIAFKVVTVAIGFLAAAVVVILLRQLSLKEAYESIEGPVLVLLGSLIPIAKSLQTTGVTDILGAQLASVGALLPGWAAVAMMLATAMILTPFLNNAAAVLMLGPVAAVVAKTLGYDPDPFLMAVALGCACDFLTPIGHQNNLLVMAPGGYRFTDYWRLGLPISLLVLTVGTPLILWFWPLGA